MAGFSDIGVFLGYAEWAKVDYYTARPMETQERILKGILKKNKDTEYGKTLDHSMHIDKKFSVVIVFS